ncbi:MAG: glycosyltransferase family 2 protein [Ignavibacteriaceae bacterium]|nr:glycosyltransferase family 2 protein [Ignavibacteriaceae bacterium]
MEFLNSKKYPSVFIVILNWNGYEDTKECLNSLVDIDYTNYKIVIVDNGSDNNDVDKIKENFPSVKIIWNPENLGFSGGNNLGIRYCLKSRADYVLLLNNDTVVEPDFLDLLFSKMVLDNQIGIAAPQINYYSKPSEVWSAGGKINKIRTSGFATTNSRISNSECYVDFVSGCCMLIKKEVIQKVGEFDEKYFLYVEDTDYCFRVLKAGYKIFVVPESKIYHKVSNSTSKKLSTIPLYYTTRNRLYLARKHFKGIFYISFIYILSAMIGKSLIWLFVGNVKNIKTVIKSFKDFCIGEMGKKRENKEGILS